MEESSTCKELQGHMPQGQNSKASVMRRVKANSCRATLLPKAADRIRAMARYQLPLAHDCRWRRPALIGAGSRPACCSKEAGLQHGTALSSGNAALCSSSMQCCWLWTAAEPTAEQAHRLLALRGRRCLHTCNCPVCNRLSQTASLKPAAHLHRRGGRPLQHGQLGGQVVLNAGNAHIGWGVGVL